MPRLRVHCFSMSADGFGAGPRQSIEHPLGVGGEKLHSWVYPTRTFRAMVGESGGSAGIDDDYARAGLQDIGAWILGRNMFGPIRGAWDGSGWRGWWGDEPPYHAPVFVLTHYPRPPLQMAGGTTFHFVTDGLKAALVRASEAAGGRDVRLGGGVMTLREGIKSRLVDEMHIAIAPVMLGEGEPVFAGINLETLGYRCIRHETTEQAMHLVFRRQDAT